MTSVADKEARTSWVLAALAGLVGAAAFTNTAGFFVTFMTGNSERAALGWFQGQQKVAGAAILLIATFVLGVVVASLCRRHLWKDHPHGATVLTSISLVIASVVDVIESGIDAVRIEFVPILFVAFAMGALNTSFTKNGEVSIPLSYVTGTLVKLGQGIERHISGGKATEWLGYALLYASFLGGAALGGVISLAITGPQILMVAAGVSIVTAVFTYRRTHSEASILG